MNSRTQTLVDDDWTILKLMNYHIDDYEAIIEAINGSIEGLIIKSMEKVTHLKFGNGGRRFTMIGAKLDNIDWYEIDLEQGKTINLADLFDCKEFSGSRSPQLKHCPVAGRNSSPFSAIVFNVIHNNAIAAKVCVVILNQIKELCKDVQEIKDMDDSLYLDVRYSRKSGYSLNALAPQFSNVMKNVLKVTSQLDLDEYGTYRALSTSAASTHYRTLEKKSEDGSKGVMFNLPLESTESEVKEAILAVYETLTGMSDQGRLDMQLPEKISKIAADDFEVQLLDGSYTSGDPYRMAFIELPNDQIFGFPDEWRTTSLYANGRPAILEKSRNDKSNKDGKDDSRSKSLGTEKKKKKRKQSERSSPLSARDDDEESDMDEEEQQDADFDAEEVEEDMDFGEAGVGGTPLATKKTVHALQKQLKSFKQKFMTKEDIEAMLRLSNTALTSEVNGRMVEQHTSAMKTLTRIHGAYEELVASDKERMEMLKKALDDCKEKIMSNEVSAADKTAAIAEVMEIEGLSAEMKAKVQEMMLQRMDTTQKQANASAVAVVDNMAAAVNTHMLASLQAQEETAKNMGQLMIEASSPAPAKATAEGSVLHTPPTSSSSSGGSGSGSGSSSGSSGSGSSSSSSSSSAGN
jgi:hypothetical protein